MRSTGNELGNWSPSTFGGMSEDIQAENAAAAAANDAALSQQARDMAAQMFGGSAPAYQAGQVSGGGGTGFMASPMLVTPQQQPNQGLPFMQNPAMSSRQDIQNFMAQMRQGMPSAGYNPMLPRTVMPSMSGSAQAAGLPLLHGPDLQPSAMAGPQMGLAGGGQQDWYAQLLRSMK
jgi:hypothetical protein